MKSVEEIKVPFLSIDIPDFKVHARLTEGPRVSRNRIIRSKCVRVYASVLRRDSCMHNNYNYVVVYVHMPSTVSLNIDTAAIIHDGMELKPEA